MLVTGPAGLQIEVRHTLHGVELHQYIGDFEIPVMTTFLQNDQGYAAAEMVQQALIYVYGELMHGVNMRAEANIGLIRRDNLHALVWLPNGQQVNLNREYIPGRDNETVRCAVVALRKMERLQAFVRSPI